MAIVGNIAEDVRAPCGGADDASSRISANLEDPAAARPAGRVAGDAAPVEHDEFVHDMNVSADSDFQDGLAEGAGDGPYIELGSPSEPGTAVSPADLSRPSDDAFIDVVIDP